MSSGAPVTDNPASSNTSEVSRKKPTKIGQNENNALQKSSAQAEPSDDEDEEETPEPITTGPRKRGGRRIVPVHQSRITDRPAKVGEKDSSLKIKIELDLEVEVEIYARVKGDIMIGLM
ncbi:hypothetical protein N0V95_006882 [Ascochyta clinopodiicola]|nr:hypothetical protein N0V95_006882 [Ascochyta clinopodiicola]